MNNEKKNQFYCVVLYVYCTAGDIRAYVEHTLKPIIEFKDPNPLQIKYFGFSSLGQSLARYFYDCRGDEVYTKSQLQSHCQHVNTASNEHTQFHRIPDNSITNTDQYSIEIPLHVAATHDAHILLASDNSFNSIRSGYEFGLYTDVHFVLFISIVLPVFPYLLSIIRYTVIGDDINRRVSIHKIGLQSTSTLGDFRRADIFLSNEVLNLVVRISRCKIAFYGDCVLLD